MANPFPGMNPYLEHPARWPSLHQRLITYACEALNEQLPEGYAAEIGERLYVVEPDRNIYPDIAVLRSTLPTRASRGGTAVAESPSAQAPWVLSVEPVEVREVFIEILKLGQPAKVVTVIEVLSHSNKSPGSQGRDLYLAKQREALEAGVSLLEIDLLRAGAYTASAPYEDVRRKGNWEYLVCLHRGNRPHRWELWPIRLRDRLPWIRVPLAQGDEDVKLDLQSIFDRSWATSSHARFMDYSADPIPPLSPEDQEWADGLVGKPPG